MGLFAFKRLREREAASAEAASFHVEQKPPEPPAQTRKPRARKLKPDGTQ